MPASFLIQAAEDPALALPALLTLGVLLVNGWTDEPQETRECHAPPPGGNREERGMQNAEMQNGRAKRAADLGCSRKLTECSPDVVYRFEVF